ncbi:Phosphoheptose isomerase 1 [bacterium HR19]|nr:Phosphoheptose isomerase 1 [bacterium HR19]
MKSGSDKMELDEIFSGAIDESAKVILSLVEVIPQIKRACELIADSFERGGKLLIFGNGGSAADAQHFSAELVGKFRSSQRKALPAIALTVDTSALTAISNDWDFEYVFERQIEALGEEGDVAFGISTSGRSKNVLRALKKAKDMGLTTISLVGQNTQDVSHFSDLVISVRSSDTQRIQEAHSVVIHLICEGIENIISNK